MPVHEAFGIQFFPALKLDLREYEITCFCGNGNISIYPDNCSRYLWTNDVECRYIRNVDNFARLP